MEVLKSSITNVKVTKLSIPELKQNLVKQNITFRLHNVTQGIANGIVRVSVGELPVKRLSFATTDPSEPCFTTTDSYANEEYIRRRLEQLPIDQTISDDVICQIEKANDHKIPIHVYTSDILPKRTATSGSGARVWPSAKLPFNDMILLDLAPGKQIIIRNIRVITASGGRFGSAYTPTMKCIDDDFESKLSYIPKNYELKINTNGDMPIVEFLQKCIKNITDRLKALVVPAAVLIPEGGQLGTAPLPSQPQFQFNFGKETHTIREIIFNLYGMTYPTGNLMTSTIDDASEMIFIMRAVDDADAIEKMKKSISAAIVIMEQLAMRDVA